MRMRRMSRVSRRILMTLMGASPAKAKSVASQMTSKRDVKIKKLSKRFHHLSGPTRKCLAPDSHTLMPISMTKKIEKARFAHAQALPPGSSVCAPMEMPLSTITKPTTGSITANKSGLSMGAATSSTVTCASCEMRRLASPERRTSRMVCVMSANLGAARWMDSSSRSTWAKSLKGMPVWMLPSELLWPSANALKTDGLTLTVCPVRPPKDGKAWGRCALSKLRT
mmetsp:Transcript_72702/g.224864  ORF Transcript_72702/g.224864 Transcript_72702/m.224864 type:complete len:225 (-) Transcript_72702:672-1346(-)